MLNERLSFTCTFYELLEVWDEFSQSIHDCPSGSPLSALAFLVELNRKTQLYVCLFFFLNSHVKPIASGISWCGARFLRVFTQRGCSQFRIELLTVFQVWHSCKHTLIKDPRLFNISIQRDVLYTLIPVCSFFLSCICHVSLLKDGDSIWFSMKF